MNSLQTSFVLLRFVWTNYINVWPKLLLFEHYVLAYFLAYFKPWYTHTHTCTLYMCVCVRAYMCVCIRVCMCYITFTIYCLVLFLVWHMCHVLEGCPMNWTTLSSGTPMVYMKEWPSAVTGTWPPNTLHQSVQHCIHSTGTQEHHFLTTYSDTMITLM